jgi:hypothetical protein
MARALVSVFVVAVFITLFSVPLQADEMWVSVDRLNRRTCPSTDCGVVGKLFFREHVDAMERRGDWVRITKWYDAFCVGGVSKYVDSGNANCVPENGVEDGKFAEWVSLEALTVERPADPSEGATGTAALVGGSDDFRIYKDAFVRATDALLASGRCTRAHFSEMGGWVKSSSYMDQPVYFTYCGSYRKIYLNADSGKITQE